MKTIRYFLCMIFVLIMFKASYAFQNEPDGFRGIKWGSEAAKYKDLTLAIYKSNTNDLKVYMRYDEKLNIGDVHINYID